MPNILVTMSVTIKRITSAAIKSQPVNKNDTTKIAANETHIEKKLSLQMLKYCS